MFERSNSQSNSDYFLTATHIIFVIAPDAITVDNYSKIYDCSMAWAKLPSDVFHVGSRPILLASLDTFFMSSNCYGAGAWGLRVYLAMLYIYDPIKTNFYSFE